MKTALLDKIIQIAEEKRKEMGSEYLTIDHIYLGMMIVVHTPSIKEEENVDSEEYDELVKAMAQGGFVDTEDVIKAIQQKEYSRADESAARDFKRWVGLSNRNAVDTLKHLRGEESFLGKKAEKETEGKNDKNVEANVEGKTGTASAPGKETGNNTSSAEAETTAQQEEPKKLPELVAETAKLRVELLKNIMGQETAVRKFAEGYFRGELAASTDEKRKGARSVFVFAGSPGVGKTYLAETAASAIGLPYKRFDMSSYSGYQSNEELVGIASHYKDSKPGALTSFVKQNPHSIIVFDEIEKASPSVILLFLQILDSGLLLDNHTEKKVSFKDVIIIMTTNAGRNLYSNSETKNLSMLPQSIIVDALKKDINPATGRPFFPEAICSRLDTGTVVMFNHLAATNLIHITDKEFSRNIENLEETYDIHFHKDERLAPTILYSVGGRSDARNATAKAKDFMYREFYEFLRLANNKYGSDAIGKITGIDWKINLDNAAAEVKALYKGDGDTTVLIYGGKEVQAFAETTIPECQIIVTEDAEEFEEAIHKKDITFAIIDYYFGADEGSKSLLNAEDIRSAGRDAFLKIKEDCPDIPVYVCENDSYKYADEEILSLSGRGMEKLVKTPVDAEEAKALLNKLCMEVCHQKALDLLALRHQVLSYETSQRVSVDGTVGIIELFDLKLTQAVEAEDQKRVLDAQAKPNKHWEDVVVSEDVKTELEFFIDYLKNPKAFMAKGAKAPSGLLMYGPPGTGKTTLAKVVATHADVTFLEASADQFVSKWAGEGPERMHQMFATARKYAPAILFIDEIDTIGKKRRTEQTEGYTGADILNALLTEMDGFKKAANKPVFVMAATNLGGNNGNTGALDPALVRRFDRSINIDLPNKEGRIKLFKIFCSKSENIKVSDEEIESLAIRSVGMSPANIEGAVETAIREAIRSNTIVDDALMDEAFEKYNSGEEKKWEESTLLRVARHEAGHAFICSYFGERPSYLTIVARDDHGGYMQHADNTNKGVRTKEDLLHNICTSMGGRAAELVYYGEKDGVTTGPSGDLQNATNIAMNMVCYYGMYGDEVGLGVINHNEIDKYPAAKACVDKIISEQLELAIRLITENKSKMDNLINTLMDKMHLTEDQIQEALQ